MSSIRFYFIAALVMVVYGLAILVGYTIDNFFQFVILTPLISMWVMHTIVTRVYSRFESYRMKNRFRNAHLE